MHIRIPCVAAVLALTLTGCGPDLPKTYPVTGKVVLVGGDVKHLVGHHVEAMLETDPAVRASGLIGPAGDFTLETLHAGSILKGAVEGKFLVRIVRAEEDEQGRKLRKPPIDNRFFRFETSGLSITVPTAGDVTLDIRSR